MSEARKTQNKSNETVADVFDTLTPKQKEAVYFIVGCMNSDNDDEDEGGEETVEHGLTEESMDDDALAHYGVLGMRWGIRKARILGKNYTYKSRSQKKTEKKLKKAVRRNKNPDKIARLESKLNMYKHRDKNREEFARTTTVGRSIAMGLALGPFGKGRYNRLRAAGYGRMDAYYKSKEIGKLYGIISGGIRTKQEEYRTANMQKRV